MTQNQQKYYFEAFGLAIQSPIPIRGLIETDEVSEPDIKVVFGKIENYPELFLTKVKRKGLSATFGMVDHNTKNAFMVWENQINFRLIDGKTMVIDTAETDLDFLSLFIVSEPLGILLFQRGDILLHASAVRLPNNTGIVFMGEPGAGKSTTTAAFVKAGCKIVSDDLVSLRLINNKPFIIPSFPQIKLWKTSVDGLGYDYDENLELIIEGTQKYAYYNEEIFENSPVLLSKIYVLGADSNKIISEIHYPIELLKYFALPEQLLEKGPPLKRHFEKSKMMAKEIIIEEKLKLNTFEELNDFVELELAINFQSDL